MIYLLLILLFIVGAFLIFLANLQGEYEVRRSRVFDHDIDTVFDKLRDFRSWPEWSPWLMHEPETKLEYSDNTNEEGGFYTWDGKLVGAGKLMHEAFDRPNKIQQRLEFTRPFKSICNVRFELDDISNNTTEVSWIMNGKMPFLMRFMVPKMKQMIGQDYDLGLAMLAGALNPETEHPKLDFVGETSLENTTCLCQGFEGDIQAMQSAMKKVFPELLNHVTENNGQIAGEPRTFYHKVDIKKMYFVCDMAVPVADDINAGSYSLKALGSGKYYQVDVTGSYEFLEQAWYSAMAHIFMLKLKMDKSRPSIEVYKTDLNTVSNTNEIITVLYIPIK